MLSEMKIKNFRNIKSFNNTLNPKGNVLIAPNGSGKTNFLESIYLSIFGRSFKPVNSLIELIGPHSNTTRISFVCNNNQIETIVSDINNSVTKKSLLNSKSTTIRKIYDKHSAIVFAPHSVDLVSSAPSLRRKDLDDFLSSLNAIYASHALRYSKILRNRNALIKAVRENPSRKSEMDFWTKELVKSANIIVKARTMFFNDIDNFAINAGEEIFNEHLKFQINYKPNIRDSEDYISRLEDKLKENFTKEIIVGKTLYGPHKDDYEFFYNERNLKYFGSRGEQRIGAFLFKIAQKIYYSSKLNNNPILLIDDIFSELDASHKNNISKFLQSLNSQFILTGSVSSEIPEGILNSSKLLTF